jgi:hypothetical protein
MAPRYQLQRSMLGGLQHLIHLGAGARQKPPCRAVLEDRFSLLVE